MRIQPTAKIRVKAYGNFLPKVTEGLQIAADAIGISKNWLQMVLIADALNIKIPEEYDYRISSEGSRKTRTNRQSSAQRYRSVSRKSWS